MTHAAGRTLLRQVTHEDAAAVASAPAHAHAAWRPTLPGLHLMGDLYECECAAELMVVRRVLRERCLELVTRAGLSTVGDYFHAFEGGGVTGTVVLSESHLSVHTWPERRYVTLDVYVCNYSEDNRDKARALYDSLVQTFAPRAPRMFALDRA
jgi:S-adenosylmethionine decarboxylase